MGILADVMVPHPPLIVPEVGRGEEEKIKDTIRGFTKATELIARLKPETIVIISPHSAYYSDYFHISPGKSASGDLGKFGARQVTFDIRYDTEFVAELEKRAHRENVEAGTMGEREKSLDHATAVPLYFLKKAYGGDISCKIVRIGLSGMPLREHYRFGTLIKKTAEELGRDVCVIASGDLSHVLKKDGPYGYRAEGPEYDRKIMDVMSRGAFGELFGFSDAFCERAAECGHRSFTIMAGCFDGVSVKAEMLSYEGPFGVGYGVCTFIPGKPDQTRKFLLAQEMENKDKVDQLKKQESPYVRLARETVERYVSTGKRIPVPEYLPEEALTRRAGTFVSLKKFGQLRGCIGTISATEENIAKEIIQNAISAAVRDPRFPPVTPMELKDLVYSVDVLGETEDIDSSEDLDVKKYGVIVSSGYRRGLLLPNLEGIEDVEEQISIAMQKAGIRKSEKIKLQRFEVVRHH
ncbi:MAG TPA: extradiol ring-cleavage dioxygenase [Synergistaceae bacterium]|nr:extradiol ring-cleavage dioxygenase [Synergistaceae bacterium]